MSDKYTLAEIVEEAKQLDIMAIKLGGERFTGATMIRQLLDDHETMRRALEEISTANFWRDSRPSNTRDAMTGIAEKALGEVTK